MARPARFRTNLCGVLALDKPAGMTSFDAVREVRRVLGERRVGHAGTLDPTATGLLPICVGSATRLVDYFHAQPKTYRCTVRFGERSVTFDTEGEVSPGGDASELTANSVGQALSRFVGDILQIPPMHSAVRHQGRHLYELAREGQEVERAPRPARIDKAELISFHPGAVAEAELLVTAGKGTYMRVLAADLGDALGTGGLLQNLCRTRYGALDVLSAISPDELRQLPEPGAALLDPGIAVAHLPRVDVAPAQAAQLLRGQPVWLPRGMQPAADGECAVVDAGGRLLAVGAAQGGLLRPVKVLSR